MQSSIPPPPKTVERIALPDAEIRVWRGAWTTAEANSVLDALLREIQWEQEEILVFGRRHPVPRLVAWHGDSGTAYTYSGTAHEPRPWTPTLDAVKQQVETLTCHRFNSVLLNRYRDGRDGMGWHADDEPELGREPAIASVTFGTTRRFQLRHRRLRHAKISLDLAHGDLLLMCGPTQHHYVHAVPKTTRPVGERINLTFRLVRIVR